MKSIATVFTAAVFSTSVFAQAAAPAKKEEAKPAAVAKDAKPAASASAPAKKDDKKPAEKK